MNCVFGGIHVHENAAGHFKAAFGFEPDCNAHINLKVAFSKKNVRVSIVKTWQISLIPVSRCFTYCLMSYGDKTERNASLAQSTYAVVA